MPNHSALEAAVAKINKYATSESGDTVEVIERPLGGISIVVADGQRSGRSAKAISNIVVRKAISLLGEGVRDGAVARATHDYLHIQRSGKVSAELNIVSVDLATRSLVISRNSRCPVALICGGEFTLLDDASEAIGTRRNTKPTITEMELLVGTTVVVFTDGVWNAGSRSGGNIDLQRLLQAIDPENSASAEALADAILAEAMALDRGRPRDDATVLVLRIVPQQKNGDERDRIRRLSVRFPI